MALPALADRASRWTILMVVPVAAAVLALVILATSSRPPRTPFSSRAGSPGALILGDKAWEATSEGDFEERTIDSAGSRVRLRAATRGTRSETVKYLGVRSREEIRLVEGTRLAVDVDWNGQANGSGLSAGIVLAPAATSENPLGTDAFLRIEYVGVPPGKKARLVVATRGAGRDRNLHTEGWPEAGREGREIGLQRLAVIVGKGGSFRLLENNREVFASGLNALPFDRGYLYLQSSTRCNYPPREVFFDNVTVKAGR